MFEFPWAYQKIEPTTWAYVSSLLMLALFFKFNRVWSIRNLDLLLIILLAPGLLLYDHGVTLERQAVLQLERLGQPARLSLTSGGQLDGTAITPESVSQKTSSQLPGPSQDWEWAGGDLNANRPASDFPASDLPASENFNADPSRGRLTAETAVSGPNLAPDLATVRPLQNTGQQEGTKPQEGAGQPESTDPANAPDPTSAATNNSADEGSATLAGVDGLEPAAERNENFDLALSQQNGDPQQRIAYWLERRSLGHTLLYTSFLFLLCVAGIFVLRLLLDQLLIRRPLLENNLSVGGLTFLVCSFLTFLVANIVISPPLQTDLYGARSAAEILGDDAERPEDLHQEMGPAYPLLHLLPVIPTMIREPASRSDLDTIKASQQRNEALAWVAKSMAIASQFAIVAGLIVLGRFHFKSIATGVGMATLYLMLPYTAQMTGRVDHVLPAALLIWAVVLYRRPFWAGIFFGMTLGLVYYPIFLLALWLSFYWEKGAARFIYGVGAIVLLLVLSLFLFSTPEQSFLQNLQGMFGVWLPRVRGLKGIWEFGWDPWFRLPFLVAYVSLCISFVAWPIRKTFGTLLAYSAAMMVAVQFWHGYGGGLFMAWYLPLTIATFFRPAMQERVAKYDVY